MNTTMKNIFGCLGKYFNGFGKHDTPMKPAQTAQATPVEPKNEKPSDGLQKNEMDIFSEDVPVQQTNANVQDTTHAQTDNIPSEKHVVMSAPAPAFASYCVCLDPGHAVTTNGKRSPYSLKKVSSPELPFEEWKFNRQVVYGIKEKLEQNGICVFVTTDEARDGDADVKLTVRAQRAGEYASRNGKKGIFVSVHSNAHGLGSEWTSAKGWSVYTTKGQNASDKFATIMFKEAEKALVPCGISMRKDMQDGDPDWEENFTVIVAAERYNMPAVLSENLFYTNINDCTFLNTQKGIDMIIDVHVNSIIAYLQTLG